MPCLVVQTVKLDVQRRHLSFKADLAANWNVVDKLELSGAVPVEDFVKVSVIDNSAYVIHFKGDSVLDLLEFAFYVEFRVLLNEFLHGLIDLALRVFRGELLQVV